MGTLVTFNQLADENNGVVLKAVLGYSFTDQCIDIGRVKDLSRNCQC